MKLYVGNLEYTVDEGALRAMFTEYGQIKSVSIIMDRDTGRSKGFGFVEMETTEQGRAAIQAMNEKTPTGAKRALTVNEARPQASRTGGFGGGGGGSHRGGGDRGGGGGGGHRGSGDRY